MFCFDGDEAGRQAAWRAMTHTLPVLTDGREARFLFLPEGEDPDSMVRAEGRAAFEDRLAQAKPLADFLIERLRAGIDTTSVGGRAQLASEAAPLLKTMPAGVYHDLLIDRLAAQVGLSPERLRADMTGDAASKRAPERSERPRRAAASGIRMTPMRTAIGLLIQNPQLAERLPDDHPALAADQPGSRLLADLRERIRATPGITTARLIEAWRDTSEQKHLERLASWPFATDAESDRDQALAREFDDTLERLGEQVRRARRGALLEAARERALSADEKRELQTLMRAR